MCNYVYREVPGSVERQKNQQCDDALSDQRSKEQEHPCLLKEDKYPSSIEEFENLPFLCLVTLKLWWIVGSTQEPMVD